MRKKTLRSIDLARDVGLSTQAIRDYERYGFIPPVERGPQGYRLYNSQHLHALRLARVLIAGYGWEHALHIMQHVHTHDLSSVLSEIDARHAALHQSRRELEQTLKILRTLSTALPPIYEGNTSAKPLYIRDVAQRAGVRVSAIRFWEAQGLVQPHRDKSSKYRLYNEQHLRTLQVIALLRKANYGFEAIRSVLDQLSSGTPEQVLIAAENRLKELAERSRHCTEATAKLWEYLSSQL
ncbi:MAG TPA: MerR family transcriptional regulator [Ktedonobacteraceae bacterium]|nr:MerR family transcriptional regulator [Ktedonobacteraceae bacterium]